METKSYRDTMVALNQVFGQYDLDFVKSLDISQLEDLFIQDAFSDPYKHSHYELHKDNVNFKIIKEQLTST